MPDYHARNTVIIDNGTNDIQAAQILNCNETASTNAVNLTFNQDTERKTQPNLDFLSEFLLSSHFLPNGKEIVEQYGKYSLNCLPQNQTEYSPISLQRTGNGFNQTQNWIALNSNTNRNNANPSHARVKQIFPSWKPVKENTLSAVVTNAPITMSTATNAPITMSTATNAPITMPKQMSRTQIYSTRDCNVQSNTNLFYNTINNNKNNHGLYSNMDILCTVSPTASHSNEMLHNSNRTLKKRQRRPHTLHQLEVLESFFQKSPYCSAKTRQQLMKMTLLTCHQIRVWFQNRRVKSKKNGELIDQSRPVITTIDQGSNLLSQSIPSSYEEHTPYIYLGREETAFHRPWFPFSLNPKHV